MRPIFLHACATSSELPSNISTISVFRYFLVYFKNVYLNRNNVSIYLQYIYINKSYLEICADINKYLSEIYILPNVKNRTRYVILMFASPLSLCCLLWNISVRRFITQILLVESYNCFLNRFCEQQNMNLLAKIISLVSVLHLTDNIKNAWRYQTDLSCSICTPKSSYPRRINHMESKWYWPAA